MLKTILTTFLLVFIAELGDKTQLTTMILVAKNKSIWPIFFGAALALVCSSLVGVFAGSIISKFVSPNFIQNAAALAFILVGILLLLGKV